MEKLFLPAVSTENLTVEEKYDAIIKEITESNANQQPILVGTTSIEKSEEIATMLEK